MKYSIDFQFMPKGSSRPSDDGIVVGIVATDQTGTVFLPNIGDHLNIDNGATHGNLVSFKGRVRSRLFNYARVGEHFDDEVFCSVNIVVEEVDDAVFDELIKE